MSEKGGNGNICRGELEEKMSRIDLESFQLNTCYQGALYILKLTYDIIFVEGFKYKMISDLPVEFKYKVWMNKFILFVVWPKTM